MITAVKGNIYALNDEIRKIIIEVNNDSSDSEDKEVEEDKFEEEAAVEDAIPEEPCVERALEDYDDHEKPM